MTDHTHLHPAALVVANWWVSLLPGGRDIGTVEDHMGPLPPGAGPIAQGMLEILVQRKADGLTPENLTKFRDILAARITQDIEKWGVQGPIGITHYVNYDLCSALFLSCVEAGLGDMKYIFPVKARSRILESEVRACIGHGAEEEVIWRKGE